MNITLRPATEHDCHFIAYAVLAALHEQEMPPSIVPSPTLQPLADAIRDKDILYSYRHTRMADVDGEPAGCFVTYDGALFETLKPLTYKTLAEVWWKEENPGADVVEMAQAYPPETCAGEYYLDSLAVLPRYREAGIGRLLVVDALCEGRRQGFHTFTGLVATDSPHLLKFYQSEGLMPAGKQELFGTEYYKLVLHR